MTIPKNKMVFVSTRGATANTKRFFTVASKLNAHLKLIAKFYPQTKVIIKTFNIN